MRRRILTQATYNQNLKRRLARQKAFHASGKAGDLLICFNRWMRYANLTSFLTALLERGPVDEILDPINVRRAIEDYVALLTDSYSKVYEIDDDMLPCATVFFGIGAVTAAMTGLEPTFDGSVDTSWLEPNLGWDEISALKFDENNKWIQFALNVNRELWRCWNEDFFLTPFMHRSPLDAANGIRGTELFMEMYSAPEKVHGLLDWCAEWSIMLEQYLHENVERPSGWGNGIWAMWLPERTVWINGDPVGLISREMQPVFEKPYTEKLFEACGRGFFHNHTIGLYQVDLVAATKGIIFQEITADPKQTTVSEALLNDKKMRDRILEASMLAPIMIDNINVQQLDELLPIISEGRFVIWLNCEDASEASRAIHKVRKAGNLN